MESVNRCKNGFEKAGALMLFQGLSFVEEWLKVYGRFRMSEEWREANVCMKEGRSDAKTSGNEAVDVGRVGVGRDVDRGRVS
jgi:hypothetical protein